MSLTSRINKYLDSILNYYEGVVCYVRGTPNQISKVLPEEFSRDFKEVECPSLKDLIIDDVLSNEVVVCNNKLGMCIHVLGNARVCVAEVSGRGVILNVDEASQVGRDDLVAYVITGKGEVRNFYSRCEGYIILIEEFSGRPQGYKIYVVGGKYVRKIR